jgi:hypothetical protein
MLSSWIPQLQVTQRGGAATQARNISRKDAKAAKKMNKIVFRTWRSSRLGKRNIRKRFPRPAQFFSTVVQTHQLGSMKISSQLANNFGYCSVERWA